MVFRTMEMSTLSAVEVTVEHLEHHQQNTAKLMAFFHQREIQERNAIVRSVLHGGDPIVLWPGMEPNEFKEPPPLQTPVFTSSSGPPSHSDSASSQPFHQQTTYYRSFSRRSNKQYSMYQNSYQSNYNRQRSFVNNNRSGGFPRSDNTQHQNNFAASTSNWHNSRQSFVIHRHPTNFEYPPPPIVSRSFRSAEQPVNRRNGQSTQQSNGTNNRTLSVTEQMIIRELRQVRRISYVELLDRTTKAVSNFCTVDEKQFHTSMDRLVNEGLVKQSTTKKNKIIYVFIHHSP
ncbi:hypothetical protein M3Y95_00417300 [Aphelenchoides besseyi]|nr:hypothetical protein M3Y95_00417300 [Aphelenchoides besseyi]